MLKILTPENFDNQAKEKCGEIFCSSTDFNIYCTFCNMKDFTFEDFKMHVQNEHFAKNIFLIETLKAESNQYLELNIKSEDITDDTAVVPDQLQEEVRCNDMEHSFDSASDFDVGDSEEEFISVLNSDNQIGDIGLDEDCIPVLNEKISSDPEDKPYKINQCESVFENPVLLDAHITQIHVIQSGHQIVKQVDDEAQLCPECNEMLPNKTYLIYHVCKIHKGFKCSFCDKRFQLPHERKAHEQSHTGQKKNFVCNVEGCDKSFSSNCYLERHSGVHSTYPNYICDFQHCGKAFHTKYGLRRHKRIHTKPKNIECGLCGYKCRENAKLKIHLRRHTGEKPYPCKLCGKPFVTSSALAEHMISHSNARPHVCEICNAAYVRKRSLYLHKSHKHRKED